MSPVKTSSNPVLQRQMKHRKWFKWMSICCFRSVYGNENGVVIEEKSTQSITHTVVSFPPERTVSRTPFDKDVFPHSQVASQYLWNFFTRYEETQDELGQGLIQINSMEMTERADKIYAQITDKEQILFYVKIFANGKMSISRDSFCDLLLCTHDLSGVVQAMTEATAHGNVSTAIRSTDIGSTTENNGTSLEVAGNEWIQAAVYSCFHQKEEMSVAFVCNWIQLHLPRALGFLHKYVIYQLAAYKAQAQIEAHSRHDLISPQLTFSQDLTDSKPQLPSSESECSGTDGNAADENTADGNAADESSTKPHSSRVTVEGINPYLLWLLEVSLPPLYAAPLEKKVGALNCPFTKRLTSQELLQQLRNEGVKTEPWCRLYDSTEEGTSVNRFMLHLYHYKGPTLIFIFAQNNYTLCVGSDEEWHESSKFWGGEDSFLLQLQPEFRFIERGPKFLYTNFSIRGYPMGIQAGKDTKDLALEIKPDFQLVSFKGIPLRINRILAFGCGSKEIKNHQAEYKKWENKQCEIQRSVPKRSRSEWSEDPDNYLLGLSGVHVSYVTAPPADSYAKAQVKTAPTGLLRTELVPI